MMEMKLTNIFLGSLCVLPVAEVYAAAMDQSGQSILPFLENGNYAEAGMVIADVKISGQVKNRPELVDDSQNLIRGIWQVHLVSIILP